MFSLISKKVRLTPKRLAKIIIRDNITSVEKEVLTNII